MRTAQAGFQPAGCNLDGLVLGWLYLMAPGWLNVIWIATHCAGWTQSGWAGSQQAGRNVNRLSAGWTSPVSRFGFFFTDGGG